MIRIKQLPPHEAHKIAAGEVVDRPTNVIKELVENAIDAGATQITVYVEQAGHQSIRIIDNGCGMSYEDAHLCIAQYATSKISSVHDLVAIDTFGFRGEALASITAVSKTVLITKEDGPHQGIMLEIEQGKVIRETIISCNTGTDITINDLFYNVPARKKFLKKPETEWRAMTQLAHAFCIAYPSIGFKFFHDGRLVINCPAVETLADRATQVWDRTVSQHLVPLTAHDVKREIQVTGIISNHHYYRYDRTQIFFFVNKRWIKNYALGNALVKGYLNVIPPQRAPLAALFITMNQADLDVNIHPRKEEVMFMHPRVIETMIQTGVKEALEHHLSAQIKKSATQESAPFMPAQALWHPFEILKTAPPEHITDIDPFVHSYESTPRSFITNPTTEKIVAAPLQKPIPSDVEFAHFNPGTLSPIDPIELEQMVLNDNESETQPSPHPNRTTYRLIGQYKKTYLLLEQEDGLFLVDQHAAHERILYELFEHRFHEVATVSLLFPHIITLSEDDFNLITPYLDLFNEHGILVEQFSNNQLIIQSTPVHLKNCLYDELVKQVISWIKEERDIHHTEFFKTIHEKMRAQMACKAAIKAGDELTLEQMNSLLDDLSKTNNRFSCPHGRPTGWLLSLHDIEKKFRRKG